MLKLFHEGALMPWSFCIHLYTAMVYRVHCCVCVPTSTSNHGMVCKGEQSDRIEWLFPIKHVSLIDHAVDMPGLVQNAVGRRAIHLGKGITWWNITPTTQINTRHFYAHVHLITLQFPQSAHFAVVRCDSIQWSVVWEI